jgi:hypothetical protein
MINKIIEPTIENYIERYNFNKHLLEKHPENAEMLNRKIQEAKIKITEYLRANKK